MKRTTGNRDDGAKGSAERLALHPIGWVRSPYHRRFGTPQQAAAADSEADAPSTGSGQAWLELDDSIPEEALRDLEGIERIWIVSWLDRGGTWAATVRPPRGDRARRGVFATRSPDRPNPIGLSAVRLLAVEGRHLRVEGIDLLDGTPILDLKPYVPYADAFPDSRAGWIDEIPAGAKQVAKRPPVADGMTTAHDGRSPESGARDERAAQDRTDPIGSR
ncbi:MAG: tRNA (N6-threonylcarbamoyladenosine(37)-N6)-methyltransferase TrmO [Deltaproteobacteria bacterium]|nr:tRNA (N6-threonylcarbamoyladenosine(37)-N6)-methyltransferase TrmO [Deltaproteobacteria bacterium]